MRWNWIGRALLALWLAVVSAGPGIGTSRAQEEPLVLALYYPWYNEDTWADPRLSDVPETPYNGFDPDTIAQHVQWSLDIGIDVLVSAWFGPRDNNVTESNLRQLLDAAPPDRLAVSILFETDSPDFFGSYEAQHAALEHLLTVHARHPAYFRYQDKPVIMFWRPRGLFIGGQRANQDNARTVQAWRELRDELDPDRTTVWIAETDQGIYLDVFDGIVTYNIAAAPDPATRLASNASTVRNYNARTGANRLWLATVMPGYDDTGLVERGDRFARGRENGAYYRRTWAGAVATNPDWISIHSFNEWVEGHQIEPSATYGNLYLDLTRELIAAWKGR